MTPQTAYDKTLVDKIIDLLRSVEGFSYFKKFYYGDPYDIPFSVMPCVVVELQHTQIDFGPTGMDNITQTVMIKLIYNKRDDYGMTNTSEVTGVRSLESFAQGIDPASSEYEAHTVVGILRKYVTVENTATNQTIDIRYGMVPRKDGPASECHITFTVEGLKVVSDRT